jgi:hypothetical protein
MDSCHYGMARIAYRDGLQIWGVAANIKNKESRTDDKGWSSSLAVWREANKSSPEKRCYEMLHRASEFDGFLGKAWAMKIDILH